MESANTFIYITLAILTVSVLWGAYEAYSIRQQLKAHTMHLLYLTSHETVRRKPQLFDQEQP